MLGEPKRQNHPIVSYVIGLIFAMLTFVVFAGVVHHLTVSPHGPQVLKFIKDKYFPEQKSAILEEAGISITSWITPNFLKRSARFVSYVTPTFRIPKIKRSGRF